MTPLTFYPHELCCAPVMFNRFVCALLSFGAREFPAKSKTREPGKLLWNAPRMDRYGWLKFTNQYSTVYGASSINKILSLMGMIATSMTVPFVTWRNKTSNPSSWSQATMVMTSPMTIGPTQKWSSFTTMSSRPGCWSMGPQFFLPHHMNSILAEAWDAFKVSSGKIIRDSSAKKIYAPSVILILPQTTRHVLSPPKSLLKPRTNTSIRYHTALSNLSRLKNQYRRPDGCCTRKRGSTIISQSCPPIYSVQHCEATNRHPPSRNKERTYEISPQYLSSTKSIQSFSDMLRLHGQHLISLRRNRTHRPHLPIWKHPQGRL